MSYVTSVLIYVPLDYQGKMQEHMANFEWDRGNGLFSIAMVKEIPLDAGGGTKVMSGTLFGGGFNYLPYGEFLDHIAAFDWPYPERTFVLITTEGDSFTIWTPEGWDKTPGNYDFTSRSEHIVGRDNG